MGKVTYSIYKITNTINDKLYIGITYDIKRRWYTHLWTARSKQSDFYHAPLYTAIRENGAEKFSIEVIEEDSDMEYMYQREQYWIQTLSTKWPHGYNQIGRKLTDSECLLLNQPKHERTSGSYSIYTYANSLTGELFSIKTGIDDEHIRYLHDARRGQGCHITKIIRSIWEQGGKVIIRRPYIHLELNEAGRLQRELLLKHGKKQSNGTILDGCRELYQVGQYKKADDDIAPRPAVREKQHEQ